MLNPFSNKGPREKLLAAEILKLRTRATALAGEIGDGEGEIVAKRDELAQLYIPPGTDTGATDRAIANLSTAEATVRAKIAALAKLETLILTKEAELADLINEKVKEETIKTLGTRERRFRTAHAGLMTALREYRDSAGDLGPTVPEAKQLEVFADALATTDLPTAETLVATLVANHIRAVRNGTAPAALPTAEAAAPPPKPASPVAATTPVFTVKPIRWREPSNATMVRYHPQYAPLDLPHELAEEALSKHLAIAITDGRVRDLKRNNAPRHTHPEQCQWLGDPGDAEPVEAATGERILHSAFDN